MFLFQIFTGNADRTTIVTNTLAIPTRAKFIRFYPVDWLSFAAMRVDVYGVPLGMWLLVRVNNVDNDSYYLQASYLSSLYSYYLDVKLPRQ